MGFEAPIKLVFPQDFLEKGLDADNFAMLGLGDIVIPGIFIALLLRFDISLKRKSNFYFNVTFCCLLLGTGGHHSRYAFIPSRPACSALLGARLSGYTPLPCVDPRRY